MAGEASLTDTYQALLSTTQRNYLEAGKMFDNIHESTDELDWMMSGNRFKVVQGGERLSVGIVHEKNSTAKSYAGSEPLDVTPQEGMTRAFVNPKQYSVSVAITGDELTANRGEEAVVNLLMEKQGQAENGLADQLSTGVHGDGTGNDSKDLDGLLAAVSTSPTTGTYASINRANNTAYRNNAIGSVGDPSTNLLTNMRTGYNDAAQGKGTMSSEPDFILTDQDTFEAYEALVTPTLRFDGATGQGGASANLGTSSKGLWFKNANVRWSTYVTDGYMYILNSNHIWMVAYAGRDIKPSGPLQKPGDQDILVNQIFFKGNIVTNAPGKHTVLSGIS
jgi:hypothetical protein